MKNRFEVGLPWKAAPQAIHTYDGSSSARTQQPLAIHSSFHVSGARLLSTMSVELCDVGRRDLEDLTTLTRKLEQLGLGGWRAE